MSSVYCILLYCIVLSGPCRVIHLFTIMICIQVESEREIESVFCLLYSTILYGIEWTM